jgi:hypothetical protein
MVWIFTDAGAGAGIGAATTGFCNTEPATGIGLRITLLLAGPKGNLYCSLART